MKIKYLKNLFKKEMEYIFSVCPEFEVYLNNIKELRCDEDSLLEVETFSTARVKFSCGSSKCGIILNRNDFFSKSYIIKFNLYDNEDSNGCNSELKNYEKAITAGIETSFAKIIYVGKINSVKFYLCERLETDFSFVKPRGNLFIKDPFSVRTTTSLGLEEGSETLLKYRRREDFLKILLFLRDNAINDVSWYNVGYDIKNDIFKIIDFSGYKI